KPPTQLVSANSFRRSPVARCLPIRRRYRQHYRHSRAAAVRVGVELPAERRHPVADAVHAELGTNAALPASLYLALAAVGNGEQDTPPFLAGADALPLPASVLEGVVQRLLNDTVDADLERVRHLGRQRPELHRNLGTGEVFVTLSGVPDRLLKSDLADFRQHEPGGDR